ncbi:DUF3311 domain-containing protein [Streptomyces sp. NBC_01089]|uniref:DUF3311 domain-containing protein n=1 Tax=Streptomyces sp. NBC_01089 TaxID=2903747 RepID=UPI00386B9133|nr:DUF3311 domain-containing protein [Streptomyces sp. NBC_01089]
MPSRTARPSGKRTALSVLIGLVAPFLYVAVAPFLLGGVSVKIFGFPFLYFWIFSSFVFTSVCLAICWYAIDGPVHQEFDAGFDTGPGAGSDAGEEW